MFYDPRRHEFPDLDTAVIGLRVVADALHAEEHYDESCAIAIQHASGNVRSGLSELSDALASAARARGISFRPVGSYVATREGHTRDGQHEDFFGHSYALGNTFDAAGKPVHAEICAYPSLGGVFSYWGVIVWAGDASVSEGAPITREKDTIPLLVRDFLRRNRDALPEFISV